VNQEDFIHHVGRHIVEPYLRDPSGPVKGFSTKYILTLSDERIAEIGGERPDMAKRRRSHNLRIEQLKAAQKIAEDSLRTPA
jgi:hypothetical protein